MRIISNVELEFVADSGDDQTVTVTGQRMTDDEKEAYDHPPLTNGNTFANVVSATAAVVTAAKSPSYMSVILASSAINTAVQSVNWGNVNAAINANISKETRQGISGIGSTGNTQYK